MGTGIRDVGSRISELHSIHSNYLFSSSNLVEPQPFVQQDQFLDIPFPHNQNFFENQNLASSSNGSTEGESHEDSNIFSDISLSYISEILMGEDDNIDNFQDLEAIEKPFYQILEKKYPTSPLIPLKESNNNSDSAESNCPGSDSRHYGNSSSGVGSSSCAALENNWPYEYSDYQLPIEFAGQSSVGNVISFSNPLQVSGDGFTKLSNLFLEPAWLSSRGVEEACKFLPSGDNLVIDLEANGFSLPLEPREERKLPEVKSEKEEGEYVSRSGGKGRKNPYNDDNSEDGRGVKQSAISIDGTVWSKDFDEVLLCHEDKFPKVVNDLREALRHVTNKTLQNEKNAKGSKGAKGRGKRQPKKEVVDLRTLLTRCAQMVAANDQRSANELLKQIRQHSSQHGDGTERLAYYFAIALEARLAGTGSEMFNSFKTHRKTATEFLKAFHLYLAACPFKKISHFFANQTILNVSEKAAKVHVVDFGIKFGFQWPSLIQRFAARPGGPPTLRITGIGLPQPGFRPAERAEETGRRLADYAQSFNVPFEYKAVASKWEDIRVEDIGIDKDEVLVVNCLYQMRYVADESVMVDSARGIVMKTIRKMNPHVFVHGIVNGGYSGPFFVARFREALHQFSALYDLLETIIPRENEQRLLLEREIFGREALNVIACEGLERTERPETYKQWQVRNLGAGFTQHPLNQDMLKKARDKARNFYHKEFYVDEDSRWLLQGWKGRIIYALSSWAPKNRL